MRKDVHETYIHVYTLHVWRITSLQILKYRFNLSANDAFEVNRKISITVCISVFIYFRLEKYI